jgi:hypothetical protein
LYTCVASLGNLEVAHARDAIQYPLKTAGREKTKIRGKSLFGNRLPRFHGNLLGQGMIPPIQIEGYRI